MSEFVDALADYLVFSGGFGQYITSGLTIADTSIQVNFRRETPAQVVLVRQSGGAGYPHAAKELQAVQMLIDGATLSGTKAKARAIHDHLHDKIMFTLSGGHQVMWMRAAALPQSFPVLSALGLKERYQFSINFQVLLVLQ
jgi:hypothetical protein